MRIFFILVVLHLYLHAEMLYSFFDANLNYNDWDGASSGLNGAVSGRWYIDKNWCVGIQYRYADNKLGSQAYQSAWIYTLKYYF